MKTILYLLTFILLAAGVLANVPYPLYGYTAPDSEVKVTAGDEVFTATSDASGYYQVELMGGFSKAKIEVNGCVEEISLPDAPGLNHDIPCENQADDFESLLKIAGGIAGSAGIIALASYWYYKRGKKDTGKKMLNTFIDNHK